MPNTTAATVPGTIIHHMPASTRRYLSCPCILVLADGSYLASLGYLGHGSRASDSYTFRSIDRGESWQPVGEVRGQIWSSLFEHDGDLYLFGTDHADRYGGRLNGRIVIRRSADQGATWSEPKGEDSGLIVDADGYHTAPVPVVVHDGRIWRAFEFSPEPERATWRALVVSAPVGADLLSRSSWTISQQYEHLWSQSQWIEGNVVVTPKGELIDLLRTNYRGKDPAAEASHLDRAAIVHVGNDGRSLHHDRAADVIDFPGGGTKFTIRHDALTGRYWSLVNKQTRPTAGRNALYLISSPDLRQWVVHDRVLFHPDPEFHAFQYVDWVMDEDDLLFVSRTAFDDGIGGPRNYHDANYITFHRISGFRGRAEQRWRHEPPAEDESSADPTAERNRSSR